MDYSFLTSKNNLINWLNSISISEKNLEIKNAAKELKVIIENDGQVLQKSYYTKLFDKYKFKIVTTKSDNGNKNIVYSLDSNNSSKIVGLVRQTERKASVRTVVPVTPSPSVTSTITPSISVTPSITVSQTITPSVSVSQVPCECHDGVIDNDGSYFYYGCDGNYYSGEGGSPIYVCYNQYLEFDNVFDLGLSEDCSCGTVSPSPTPLLTETPTITPSVSGPSPMFESPTPSITESSNVTVSPTPTVTSTPSTSLNVVTVSLTPSITVTPSESPGVPVSLTPSITVTPSESPGVPVSLTPSITVTPSESPGVPVSLTPTATSTPSVTVTPSETVTPSVTPTPSITPSATPALELLNNLVAYYSFNNQDPNDDSICNFDLTNGGGATYTTESKDGYAALDTGDNADSYVYEPSLSQSYFDFNNKSFTFSLWFKKKTGRSLVNQTLLSWGGGNDLSINLVSDGTNSYDANFKLNDGTTTNTLTSTAGIGGDDVWNLLVARYNADTDTMKINISGDPADTLSSIGSLSVGTTSSFLSIGREDAYQNQANVVIDEVAIWYRSLTDSEVVSLYNSGTGTFLAQFAGTAGPCS